MSCKIILVASILLLSAQKISSKPTSGILRNSNIQTPTSHSSQYLLITPQTKQAYKILPHYIQPLSNLNLPREELVFYYPTTQLSDDGNLLPLVPFQQDDNNTWWQTLWNFFNGQEDSLEVTSKNGIISDTSTENLKPESENSIISDKPQMIKHNDQYYVISGAPQFYGNFESNNPVSPFISVQTLQPVTTNNQPNFMEREVKSSDRPNDLEATE
jgi:hypothetical protein